MNMFGVGRVSRENIADEIEEISAQISGREREKLTTESSEEIMQADDTTLYGKARNAFFRRVAYFAMTRILLARVWEDIGFIEQSLYDSGFAKWYENFNREIRRVLNYAFELSEERYPWLFNTNNNYSWYKPSDDALIDSLYELSNFLFFNYILYLIFLSYYMRTIKHLYKITIYINREPIHEYNHEYYNII
ncbi:hypothetical protein ES705_40493 [subsurface metagenome]